MFTVKATYRSETRKITFPEDVFPSYIQLCSEVRSTRRHRRRSRPATD